ncbi:UDP-Glycosyltransferase superfamily protein [Perilla frutescens var. hirtella]|nr:UDP-Glycosyltransferase superfamily protein [Perilla frutescens var. hirtella]KAH6806002.1 UDP-Glycosyltransferase superfamily protein [Perilla frutescens var. frutescens]
MASNRAHAVMVCFHLQGHIIPFVNLALKLASKGFTITFAHLDFVHQQISKSQYNATQTDIFAAARSSGLDIRYTTFSDGHPLDFDRSVSFDQWLEIFRDELPDKVDDLVGTILQSDSSTAPSNYFLIADTLYTWPKKIAQKYGLVNVSFWTEPALVFSLYYHLELLRENGHVPVNGRREIVNYLPGIESINTKDFMSYLHDTKLGVLHDIMFGAFDDVKTADFILCNTVQDVEADTISALQQKHPFYAIGPLFPADSANNSIAKSLLPESSSADWLNSRPPGSVLYVSFGSLAKTDKKVILEIAGGLLLSGVNFIWVLRPGMVDSITGDGGVLPEGFEDGTRERGMVVPWCSQNEVLRNPAIGGFLTHCGWNSILESIWSGVPMICYPLFTDQITNRKLVVDDWRVGINLCDGESMSKEEVAEKIEVLMSGKRSQELRQEIQKVRTTFQNAISVGGSSDQNFDRFVLDVSQEILRRSCH